jgi:hypothetical protein
MEGTNAVRACGALLMTTVLAACGATPVTYTAESEPAAPTATATATATATETPTETPSSRCDAASPALVAAIETGLTVTGGGSLSDAWVVKSDDFETVYFVAANIEGEGVSDTVGVWATNDPAGGGYILAADSFARELSDWGTGLGFSSSDDGFAEARECAEA